MIKKERFNGTKEAPKGSFLMKFKSPSEIGSQRGRYIEYANYSTILLMFLDVIFDTIANGNVGAKQFVLNSF